MRGTGTGTQRVHNLNIRALIEPDGGDRPSIVFIHGAANSSVVWKFWQAMLCELGWSSFAIDLRGHGQSGPERIDSVSMAHYAADVESLVRQLSSPPVLIGWSMGGLVGMQVAAEGLASALITLEPSESVSSADDSVQLRSGMFGGEEYGITDAASVRAVAPGLDEEEAALVLQSISNESRYARDERKRGVVIESLPVPSLMVADPAREDYHGRYQVVRRECDRLGTEACDVESTSHWDLVLNRRWLDSNVPPIVDWLGSRLK